MRLCLGLLFGLCLAGCFREEPVTPDPNPSHQAAKYDQARFDQATFE